MAGSWWTFNTYLRWWSDSARTVSTLIPFQFRLWMLTQRSSNSYSVAWLLIDEFDKSFSQHLSLFCLYLPYSREESVDDASAVPQALVGAKVQVHQRRTDEGLEEEGRRQDEAWFQSRDSKRDLRSSWAEREYWAPSILLWTMDYGLKDFQSILSAHSVAIFVPPDHLFLDRSFNIGPLIYRWELGKFKSCWNKSFRTSKIRKLLHHQFSNLLISQRDISGPRLGALSNNRWSEGIWLFSCALHVWVELKGCKWPCWTHIYSASFTR